jgi:hypothetical protein
MPAVNTLKAKPNLAEHDCVAGSQRRWSTVRGVAISAEHEVEPDAPALPPGVQLEYQPDGGVRVRVRIATGRRLLLLVPRVLSLLAALVLLYEAWRRRVFIFFWFFGLPFVRWLRGPRQSSVLIGERALEIEGARWFGATVVLPRLTITRIEIGRAGPLQSFQVALYAHTKEARPERLFVGLSAAQAEYVNAGLQRWLAEQY